MSQNTAPTISTSKSTMPIRLIVGLGNIGVEYANTRHNVGWWLLDEIAKQYNARFLLENKFFAEVAKFNHANPKVGQVFLVKPQTYMNLSGKAVAAIANFYKILPAQILVLHDDLDLDVAMMRLKKGGSHAGHNGLKSMDQALSTQDYWRWRLGIHHPRRHELPQIQKMSVADYVLNAPTQAERKLLDQMCTQALQYLDAILQAPATKNQFL